MKIENKMEVLEDDIANTHLSSSGKEEGSISKDAGGVGIEHRSPKFFFHQSNLLYI